MRLVIFLLVLGVSFGAQAFPLWGDASCAVKNDTFVLDLGRSKTPTYAGVVLPDGRFLKLRYAPERIDTVGRGYDKGELRLPLRALEGVNDKKQHEKVFTTRGKYHFVMQDANTAEGMELHRIECDVVLSKSLATRTGT